MSSILDRLKSLAVKVEADLPSGVQKLTVVVEQKTAAAEAALKREAAALENAMTPEVESYLSKIETSIANHTPALAHLFETQASAAAPAAGTVASAVASVASVFKGIV